MHLSKQPLPCGWVEYLDNSSASLIFIHLSVNVPLLVANTTFVVRIDNKLKWRVSCCGVLIDIQESRVLSGFSPQINSAQDVFSLLKKIQSSRVCSANLINDFKQLVDEHGTDFMDSSGNIHACMCY